MRTRLLGWVASTLIVSATAVYAQSPVGPSTDASAKRPEPTGTLPSMVATTCAPGQPIKGVIVKGGQNPPAPNAAGCVTPPSTDKSISEKGVAPTKGK